MTQSWESTSGCHGILNEEHCMLLLTLKIRKYGDSTRKVKGASKRGEGDGRSTNLDHIYRQVPKSEAKAKKSNINPVREALNNTLPSAQLKMRRR